MPRVLILLLSLLYAVNTFSRSPSPFLILSKDSLPEALNIWLYTNEDNASFAQVGFDDKHWKTVQSGMWYDQADTGKYPRFEGIGWFRIHLNIDSTLVDHPLAIQYTQMGASEIYLDGALLHKTGRIDDSSSINRNRQNIPFVFTLKDTGNHVLAIRYANFDVVRNFSYFNERQTGFQMIISDANRTIVSYHLQSLIVSFALVLLFGIFLSLSFTHGILYFYYKAEKSNLFFSLFSLSLALGFLIPYIGRFTPNPTLRMTAFSIGTLVIALACFSLSGFVNSLFGSVKLRFKLIAAASILIVVTRFLDPLAGLIANVILMSVVTLEAIILIGRAIYQKVPGSRIIGTGFMFFSLLFLSLVTFGLFNKHLDIDDSTPVGKLVELIIVLAILSIPFSMSRYLAWRFSNMNRDLANQLIQVRNLSERALKQEQEKKLLLENRREELEQEVAVRTMEVLAQKQQIELQHEELKQEKQKTDELLRNILPEGVAMELKETGSTKARLYDQVSVLFTDFVNFTQAAEVMDPGNLVEELHTCFKAFDEIVTRHGLEKIKTIGDAYLAVAGLPEADPQHACKAVSAAMEILNFMETRKEQLGDRCFRLRVGIHSGPLIAGIVGVKKFAYDIWGDTVNTAARMEQASEPGKINISQTTYNLVKAHFPCRSRGEILAKNKGTLSMYFVEQYTAGILADDQLVTL